MNQNMDKNSKGPVRLVIQDDIPALKRIVDDTDMFPSEMLDDMIADYLHGKCGDELWLTYDEDGARAIAHCPLQGGTNDRQDVEPARHRG